MPLRRRAFLPLCFAKAHSLMQAACNRAVPVFLLLFPSPSLLAWRSMPPNRAAEKEGGAHHFPPDLPRALNPIQSRPGLAAPGRDSLEVGAPRCVERMTPAQDPFYIVKDEIQDSIDKVQDTFHQWKQTPENTGEYVHLTKELLAICESIQWQVDELEKAISVAERDPAYYGLTEVEIGKRRNWTSTARNQVVSIRRNIEAGKQKSVFGHSANPNESGRSKQHMAQDNDDFIASESDQQMLLIRRQDEELDALSASVQRIGGVGLTIHDELVGQEKLLGELSLDMETTSNRLDFVQKRVAMVLKKASLKGQIMMIAFLVFLFIILFVLVFLT